MNGLFLRVHLLRILFFAVFLLTINVLAVAQNDENAPRRGSKVIDDTTKQIYGPKTSRYFFEEDAFMNHEVFHFVDTTIRNFHLFTDVQRLQFKYQDLGNIGTAMNSTYYRPPDVIGVRSGYYVYDVYWDKERVRYWDTKSTYSNMRLELGGFGRARTKASYSRNINPRWNFGFDYRGILADKQYNRAGKGDRNVRSTYYDVFTTYQTKDSTYRIFANMQRQYHRVNEQGGVRADLPTFEYEGYFDKEAQPKLVQANSSELRSNFHIFQQYAIGRGLQLYHKLDRSRQGNRFTDQPSSEADDTYFDYFEFVDSDTTEDRTKFKTVRNEVGVKGSLAKLFYNGYVAYRKYYMTYQHDTLYNNNSRQYQTGSEMYVGGRVALNLDSLVSVSGFAEYLLDRPAYRIEGTIQSKWFDAMVRQMQYEPSFLSQYYRGSHDFWWNNFDPTNSTELVGNIHYKSEVFSISPGISLLRMGNYIYYKSASIPEYYRSVGLPKDRIGEYPEVNPDSVDVIPFQSPSEIIQASPQVRVEIRMLKHIYLRGLGIYTKMLQDKDNAINVPELFINGQLSYENIFFNSNFDMHGGVDVHWNSPYYAMAYDVPTQQFYIQGEKVNTPFLTNNIQSKVKTPSYPVIDLFLSARIKRGRIFFRYNNVLNTINKKGYFPTPLYPGQRSMIDFGFDWSFFD